MIQNVIGYIIGLLGIIFALVIYKISKKEKCPIYVTESLPIIGQEHAVLSDKVKILYRDTPVKRISRCNLTIKNIGKTTIERNDISEADRLCVNFENTTSILDAQIIKTTREPISFNLDEINKNSIYFSFDFLDKDDGALIEVIHDGSYAQSPTISGTIKGAPKGFGKPQKSDPGLRKYHIILPILFMVMSMYLIFNESLMFDSNNINVQKYEKILAEHDALQKKLRNRIYELRELGIINMPAISNSILRKNIEALPFEHASEEKIVEPRKFNLLMFIPSIIGIIFFLYGFYNLIKFLKMWKHRNLMIK